MTEGPPHLPVDHVPPARVTNFRDLGGLSTEDGRVIRPGCLLRSAALCALSTEAIDALVRRYANAVYVDLRTPAEVRLDGGPDGLLARGWRCEPMPVQDKEPGDDDDSAGGALRRYRTALPRYLEVAGRVATLLCARPVVVGCALGKDRTGLVIAILLHWLGVRRADIVADFVASNAGLAGAQRHLLPPRWHDPARRISPTHARVCATMLDALDAPGRAAEVPAWLPALRRSVLAPAP